MPSIELTLTNVFGEPIKAKGTAGLRNQTLSSRNQLFTVEFDGTRSVTLKDVPGFPNGLAQMDLSLSGYLFRKLFVNVPANGTLTIRELMFVDPRKAKPVFPSFTKLPEDVLGVLKRSKWKAADWDELAPEKKAGLMNIYAKARTVKLSATDTAVKHFTKLQDVLPARIFVFADAALLPAVEAVPAILDPRNGALHEFPPPFELKSSFKTRDNAGNLQLTFGQDTSGEGITLVDADLDDHAGVEHWIDVFRHKLTGEDTHPYNIHEILMAFQGIDPGYRLA